MHGLDWEAVLRQYLPLVARVTDRAELADLQVQMASELRALHIGVWGGEFRQGRDQITVASLGARLERDVPAGGYRVTHIYLSDPDDPARRAPLLQPGVEMSAGDLILAIDGVPLLSVADPALLLREQAGRQVRLSIETRDGGRREAIVVPIGPPRAADLRYDEWEQTRRRMTQELGGGEIGYVHLRSMGAEDIGAWYRQFYPVIDRRGLIVDVRHNTGGNIDSWILERLMRRAWMYWQPRVGAPYWNMQSAFRGHMVVLVDEWTMSDGEAFAEGFRRLGLGKVIGTRTWGGEIWLSSSNVLVDRGIATAAEYGVYGPQGEWLIEGHGVDPDIVVDDPPHATFLGEDAQLEAAIRFLERRIAEDPIPPPEPPAFPDKSFDYPRP
jgi:tricorn protease